MLRSGHNGLAAAITLAQHGVATTIYERSPRVGGVAHRLTVNAVVIDMNAKFTGTPGEGCDLRAVDDVFAGKARDVCAGPSNVLPLDNG